MEGSRTGKEDMARAMEARRQRKAGRRATAISIRCTREELATRIEELNAREFEPDDDFSHQEMFDSAGASQHIVVLHVPDKYDELVSMPGITAETRCF